ncbi:MAG TPA: hypothetical protein VMB34_26355, partial [Acetobacteraceae bacterium]|nr:hypothetical protein [Acetobacteraceae bacterium]
MRRSLQSTLYSVAALVLAVATASRADATPMQLTLTAHDITTNTFFTDVFTDAGTPNSITV